PAGSWYVDVMAEGPAAAQAANQRSGYVLWGLPPFLRLKHQAHLNLEPLVVGDPLFQRIMVSIIVNPDKIQGVDADGAKAFESYLLARERRLVFEPFAIPISISKRGGPPGGTTALGNEPRELRSSGRFRPFGPQRSNAAGAQKRTRTSTPCGTST